MTVLERLRELQKRAMESEAAIKHETDNNMCALYRRNIVAFNKAVDAAFPTLLALAEAVEEEFGGIEDFGPAATVYVRGDGLAKIGAALAELEKEATNGN